MMSLLVWLITWIFRGLPSLHPWDAWFVMFLIALIWAACDYAKFS